MNKEDIIRMARKADKGFETDTFHAESLVGMDAIERFAALVAEHKQKELDRIFDVLRQISMLTDLGGEVAEYQDVVEAVKRIAVAEREACAQVCDRLDVFAGVDCAEAIRARGQSPLVTPRGSLGEEV